MNSTSKVTIGDGTTVTTERETAIRADNTSEKAWKDGSEKENATSAGAALASGNGVVSVTKITHTTEANLGKVTLQASASDLTAEERPRGRPCMTRKPSPSTPRAASKRMITMRCRLVLPSVRRM